MFQKKFEYQKLYVSKQFWLKTILGQTKFGPNKL